MIEIEYENSIDDAIAYNVFHYDKFIAKRVPKWIPLIMTPLIIATWTFLLIIEVLYGFFTLGIIMLIIMPIILSLNLLRMGQKLNQFIIKREAKKLYSKGENKGFIGKHVMTLAPDELTETTEVNETKQKWSGVEKIVENDDYIFIYISALNAHIIPKRAFENESDVASFVETAKQYKEQSSS